MPILSDRPFGRAVVWQRDAPQADAFALDARLGRGETGERIEDVHGMPAGHQRAGQAPGVDLGAAQAFGWELMDGEGNAHLHTPRN